MAKPEHTSDEIGTKYVVSREKRISGERSRRDLGSSQVSTLPQFWASLVHLHRSSYAMGVSRSILRL